MPEINNNQTGEKNQKDVAGSRLTAKEISAVMSRNLKDYDQSRMEHLEGLMTVKKAKVNNLTGDKQRLIRKYSPQHPRVIAVDKKIVAVKYDIAALDHEIKGATDIKIPVGDHLWTVKGRVTWSDGEPVTDAVVSLYDKDLFFDDYLGTRELDADGNYEFVYHTEGFRDFVEARPDIYIKVVNKDGLRLYGSRKKIKYEAGQVETFNIQIKKTS